MRWEYPDPSDAAEARQRERVTAAMDRWWEAFATNADAIDAHFTKGAAFDLPQFTNSFLNDVVEGLCWEYGPAVAKPGHRLVITPEGTHARRPLVRELLRRAPSLPRWEFYPGRLPERPEVAFAVAEQIARFKADDVMVRAALGDHRRVDLTFHIGNARGNEDAARHWVYRATEQLLGEDVLDHWLGVIDLAPAQSKLKRLLGGGGGRPVGLIPPERLQPTVDALIAASRDQLPDPPPRVRARQNRDGVAWTTFGLRPDEQPDYPERDDLFFVATCEPELFRATAEDRVFHSPRFSRAGEKFAYLKIDRTGDAPDALEIDSAEARGAIEDAVAATLGEHGLGCTTGGGTGLKYAYVDLALTDVRGAIPVLRDLLRRHRVSARSWLLFYEPELADEWVGVHAHTPPPPARLRDDGA